MEQIILSICLVTYNHEKYIKQCLDSILSQYLPFSYEIIVADDCSTDRTIDIIREEYGEKVELIERTKNMGLSRNILDLCVRTRGEFIIRLAGDDYFEVNDALFKMVSFLQNNKEYGSATGWNSVYNEKERKLYKVFSINSPQEYSLLDFLKGNIPGWYNGVMRNPYGGKKIESYEYMLNGARNNDEIQNWIVQLEKGKMYIFKEYLTVYRYVNTEDACNYNSNHKEIDIFKDVYLNIKTCERALSYKYNLLPLKMSWLNHYCIKLCANLRTSLEYFSVVSIKDMVLLIQYKLYLKMHQYHNPLEWSTEEYLIK